MDLLAKEGDVDTIKKCMKKHYNLYCSSGDFVKYKMLNKLHVYVKALTQYAYVYLLQQWISEHVEHHFKTVVCDLLKGFNLLEYYITMMKTGGYAYSETLANKICRDVRSEYEIRIMQSVQMLIKNNLCEHKDVVQFVYECFRGMDIGVEYYQPKHLHMIMHCYHKESQTLLINSMYCTYLQDLSSKLNHELSDFEITKYESQYDHISSMVRDHATQIPELPTIVFSEACELWYKKILDTHDYILSKF
jgi:hypothetical protein